MARFAHGWMSAVAGLILGQQLGGCGLLLDSGWPPEQPDGAPVDMPIMDGGSKLDAAVGDARVMDAAGLDVGAADSGIADAGPAWTAWATSLGGSGNEGAETLDIREGAEDYEVLAGLDGESFPPHTPLFPDWEDILIAHYASNGDHLSTRDRYYASPVFQDINAVVAAPAGQTLECGRLGTVSLPGGFVVDSADLVARDSTGTPEWVRGEFMVSCLGAAVLPDGGAVAVSGRPVLDSIEAFDAAGDLLWNDDLGGGQAAAVATSAGGEVFVAGAFAGDLRWGGSPLTSTGLLDIYVGRYAADGTAQWFRRYGGGSSERATAMTLDPAGNVIVVGWFEGTADFAGTSLTSTEGMDLFVLSLASDGARRWARRFGGTRNHRAVDVSTDGAGNVYVTGVFNGWSEIAGAPVFASGDGAFVLSLTTGGVPRWSFFLVGDAEVRARAIAAAPDGSVWVAGEFRGTTSFGTPPLASAGGSDAFLVKLQQTAP